jgi:hypothetical protein
MPLSNKLPTSYPNYPAKTMSRTTSKQDILSNINTNSTNMEINTKFIHRDNALQIIRETVRKDNIREIKVRSKIEEIGLKITNKKKDLSISKRSMRKCTKSWNRARNLIS